AAAAAAAAIGRSTASSAGTAIKRRGADTIRRKAGNRNVAAVLRGARDRRAKRDRVRERCCIPPSISAIGVMRTAGANADIDDRHAGH
ncbi:hypothetical protein, partial [Bradyrhizobium sp.]|uniref:hypothetical protein n=1 Tax=Bradyrhizobium sp. TaxID=376 RepID=UPI003C7079D5